jgi:hypothetical protein
MLDRTAPGEARARPLADFDTIYATDLAWVPKCWTLCGDAHCCGFSRHRARFRLVGGGRGIELPLLPGEYDYLRASGRIAQFGAHERRVVPYGFGRWRIAMESIVTERPGCACAHDRRLTVCRLYPVIPLFDTDGRVTGTRRLGVYDALEEIDGGDRICRVETTTFAEFDKLLAVAAAIARDPRAAFHVSAYALALDHVAGRVRSAVEARPGSAFAAFERLFLTGRLIDHDVLGQALADKAEAFAERHGDRFMLP